MVNEMKFFDYIYCRLYWWNTKIIKEKEASFYSIVGLSVFQCFGIILVVDICGISIWDSMYIDTILSIKHLYLILGIIVLLIDFVFYNKKKRNELCETFINIAVKKKKKLDILCIFYIAIIVIVNILISNYMRLKYEG